MIGLIRGTRCFTMDSTTTKRKSQNRKWREGIQITGQIRCRAVWDITQPYKSRQEGSSSDLMFMWERGMKGKTTEDNLKRCFSRWFMRSYDSGILNEISRIEWNFSIFHSEGVLFGAPSPSTEKDGHNLTLRKSYHNKRNFQNHTGVYNLKTSFFK